MHTPSKDPADHVHHPRHGGCGGNAWSSYWYNGFIYANDNRGVDTFLLSDKARAGARTLPYLNPQTQMSVIR